MPKNNTKQPAIQLSKEDELFLDFFDDVRFTLLDSLQDSVFEQAVQLHELVPGRELSRELRKAVDAAFVRFRRYTKPPPQTAADKAAGIWRDKQGRGWRIPTKAEAAAQKKAA